MCLAPGMKDRFSWNADQSTLDALQNGSLGVVELLHCTPGHQYQVPSANVAETAWLFMTASEVTEHRCHYAHWLKQSHLKGGDTDPTSLKKEQSDICYHVLKLPYGP